MSESEGTSAAITRIRLQGWPQTNAAWGRLYFAESNRFVRYYIERQSERSGQHLMANLSTWAWERRIFHGVQATNQDDYPVLCAELQGHGMTVPEIGFVVGVPVATVRVHLQNHERRNE